MARAVVQTVSRLFQRFSPEAWYQIATELDWITYHMWVEEGYKHTKSWRYITYEYLPSPEMMRKELLSWLTDDYGWKDESD